jgi:hypothetical protein
VNLGQQVAAEYRSYAMGAVEVSRTYVARVQSRVESAGVRLRSAEAFIGEANARLSGDSVLINKALGHVQVAESRLTQISRHLEEAENLLAQARILQSNASAELEMAQQYRDQAGLHQNEWFTSLRERVGTRRSTFEASRSQPRQ